MKGSMLRDYVVRSLPETHGRQLSSSQSPLASIYNMYAPLRLPYIACGAEKAAVPDRRTVFEEIYGYGRRSKSRGLNSEEGRQQNRIDVR